MMEQRQRDEAAHLQRALQRQLQVEQVQMQRAVRQNVRFGSEYYQNYEVKCCFFTFLQKKFLLKFLCRTNVWMYR